MIDAHTHLDFPDFDPDRDRVVARARDAGVEGFVVAGADPACWDRVQRTAEDLGAAWTLGAHPWWLPDLDEAATRCHLDDLAARATPHGIGETGLDHARARDEHGRRRQEEVCREHLALARSRNVPVVLHCVRAYPQLLRLLERDGLPEAGGMVHAWSGSPDLVRRAVRLGLRLSFGSPLTRSDRMAEALRRVPDDHLLLETDCPDQPLHRGARGEPADLVAITACAARIREVPPDRLASLTAANARRLFPALA